MGEESESATISSEGGVAFADTNSTHAVVLATVLLSNGLVHELPSLAHGRPMLGVAAVEPKALN